MNPLERKEETCPTCGGSGEVHNVDTTINSGMLIIGVTLCPTCNGNKTVPESWQKCAERCAGIARELANKLQEEVECICCFDRSMCFDEDDILIEKGKTCIQARIEAAAKAVERTS